jgi:hypothetical protein
VVSEGAVRILVKWESTDAIPGLLDVARTTDKDTLNALALRGFLRLMNVKLEQTPFGPEQAEEVRKRVRDALPLARTGNDRSSIEDFLNKLPPPAREAPVGWWKPEEAKGSRVVDSSGRNHHGTLKGGASVSTASGEGNPALKFNGRDSFVSAQNPSGMLLLSGEFSVTAWIHPARLRGKMRILTTSHKDRPVGWGFGLNNHQLELTTFSIKDHRSKAHVLKPKTWQHVAVSFDREHRATFYINGIEAGQDSGGGPAVGAGTFRMDLGALAGKKGPTECFHGEMRDIRVFNRALSSDEITGIFQGSKSVKAVATPNG